MPLSSSDEGEFHCKTPSPRSSASQAPPNPRHNPDEPPPRINLHQHLPTSSRPSGFKGFSKILSKGHSDHRRGRSDGAQFELGRAPHEAPNVRERVKRWQAAVEPEEIIEPPPICPATPSPAGKAAFASTPMSERRMSSVLSSELRSQAGMAGGGIASMIENDMAANTPLSPPRMPAVRGKEDWDSASEEEKKAQRRRAMSQDRERRMRRKRNSMPANFIPDQTDGIEAVMAAPDPPSTPAATAQTIIPPDDGIRVRALGEDDDGIRVTPMKTKRKGSKRKKRAKDDPEDGSNVTAEQIAEPAPEPADDPKPAANEPKDPPPAKAEVPADPAPTETKSDLSAKYKTWDDDGIRIFGRKTPIPVRSERNRRQNSIRQSAKSVRLRREEFEAQWRKEQAAEADFKARIRKQEAESNGNVFQTDAPADSEREPPAPVKEEIEEPKPSSASQKSKWDDYDDGIRVVPIKTKGKTKQKKSLDSLERKRSKSLHKPSDHSLASGEAPDDLSKPKPLDTSKKTTESAPATPTGSGHPRRDANTATPLSVKERARRLEQGLGPFDFESVGVSPAIQKLALQSESPRVLHPEDGHHSEGNGPTKDSARRQRRKQLREVLKENEVARKRDVDLAVRRKKEREQKLAEPARLDASDPLSKSQKDARKSQIKTPGSSTDNLPLKREKTKSAPTTPQASTESLPLKKTTPDSRPTSSLDSRKSLDSAFPDMTSYKTLSNTGRATPVTTPRVRKRKDSSSFTPKLAAATSTFLKFVKEETQGRRSQRNLLDSAVSARATTDDDLTDFASSTGRGTPVKRSSSQAKRRIPSRTRSLTTSSVTDSESESDDETDSESTTESDSEESQGHPGQDADSVSGSESESTSGSASDKTVEQALPKAPTPEPVKPLKPKKRVISKSSKNSIEEEPKPEPKQTEPKPEPVKVEQKVEAKPEPAKAEPKKTEPKPEPVKVEPKPESKPEPRPETKPETKPEPKSELKREQSLSHESLKRRKTKSRRKSSLEKPVEVVPPSPPPPSESPKPKRRIRDKPALPRPKSFHGRTGSDGSITPTSSVVGSAVDDNNPATETETEPNRQPSDASTVKPLRVKKRQSSSSHRPQRHGSKTSLKHSKSRRVSRPSATYDSSAAPSTDYDREAEDWYNPEISVKAPSLKRKYTKHADLISILSVEGPRSSRSASVRKSGRSSEIRRSHDRPQKNRKTVETLKIADLMKELQEEEVRYRRELRTLVDDVVPVLFQTVLGRADDDLRRTSSTSSARTSSTSGSGRSRSSFTYNPTKPIVDMGITLERLKTLHERMPKQDVDQLMTWANDARRVYEEYLSVWRMGFQDVVVAMPKQDSEDEAPENGGKDSRNRKDLELLHGARKEDLNHKYEGDPSTWDMPPPPQLLPEEEVQHEKVDVAFLLKRPLVRLKALAKLFKRINYIKSSVLASSLSNGYHILVTLARRKISEEKGRLEDEAAASLDCSSVVDMRLLLPKPDVSLNQHRRVKARDQFNMRLYHSSGRVVQCNVELILRDATNRRNSEQEILFVEIGAGGVKWLLFPPVSHSMISARTGDAAGEIVVMVRGMDQSHQEWREVMALASATAEGFEWVQMLGLQPIPPEGPFTEDQMRYPTVLETVIEESVVSSRVKSPAIHEVPLVPTAPLSGEKSSEEPTTPTAEDAEDAAETQEDVQDMHRHLNYEPLPPGFSVVPLLPTGEYKFFGGAFMVPALDPEVVYNNETVGKDLYRSPSLHTLASEDTASKPLLRLQRSRKATRPSRKNSASDSLNENLAAHSSEMTLQVTKTLSRTKSIHLDEDKKPDAKANVMDNIPKLAPLKIVKKKEEPIPEVAAPPPVPPHRSPTPSQQKSPVQQPSPPTSIRSGLQGRRRTSSPLKHEYAPSSSESEEEEEHDEEQVSVGSATDEEEISDSGSASTYTSDSSTEESETETESESGESLCSEEETEGEYPMPTLAIAKTVSRQPSRVMSVQRLRKSSSSAEIEMISALDHDAEEGASTVRPNEFGPSVASVVRPGVPILTSNFRASIFKWSVNNWEAYYPGDCKITIMPGRLEVYPFSDAGSDGNKPNLLFTLDLTLATPMSRGTVVDITLRTSKSSALNGANIMFRCRNINECDQLFKTIDMNRVYPANFQMSSTTINSTVPSDMGASTTTATSNSFAGSIRRGFSFRRKTYRADSTATQSLMSTPSETSVGSLASAFSRFRARGIFKSSPLASTASSSSTNVTEGGGSSPANVPSLEELNLDGIDQCTPAMAPMKIHFYRRETSSKWRDLGNCRLHVLKPLEMAAGSKGVIYRVVVTNKKGDKLLLDETLGETAFERVARTGIAINILTAEVGEEGVVNAVGGIGAKNMVYMMSMKGEAEAAYTFSILGRQRY